MNINVSLLKVAMNNPDIFPVAYTKEQSKYVRELAKEKGCTISEALRSCLRCVMDMDAKEMKKLKEPWWTGIVKQLFLEHNEIIAELRNLREVNEALDNQAALVKKVSDGIAERLIKEGHLKQGK